MGKLLKDMKFEDILKNRIDMEKVDLESIKPWISNRITDLIKQEDEVLIDYIYNQLDIKFPDPKEIQTNLSGFLSYTNARIFTGELWKELIDAMGSNANTKNGSCRITTNDKVKSFPRLGPSENKPHIDETIIQKKSFEKKDECLYRSSVSEPDSISSCYNSRIRSISSNHYKDQFDFGYKKKIRSRTESSSRYTPYTRYSRYTESYESSSNSSSSTSNYNIRSYSTYSSSSSYKSEIPKNFNSNKETNVHSIYSNSFSPVVGFYNCEEAVMENVYHIDSIESIERANNSVKNTDTNSHSSQSSSGSVSYMSLRNAQSRKMSQSSYSSSSEYSIEYREKISFQPTEYMRERNCFHNDIESDSEIEWVTVNKLYELNEYGYIHYEDNCFYFTEELSSYPVHFVSDSDSSSCSTSQTCTSDIEWVDLNQFQMLSDEYFRI